MIKRPLFITCLWLFANVVFAQTPAQEAANGFALFSKSKDFKQLDKAKKAIDRIYKTKKDSLSYKNNLLRAMIYSTLASADAKRTLSYKHDPSEEALLSLGKLKNTKQDGEHDQEIVFVRKKLAVYFIEKANAALQKSNFAAALKAYELVDSLSHGDWKITHNLALLNERSGNTSKAEVYYKQLTEDRDHSSPEYFLSFANMYEEKGDLAKTLAVLQKGRVRFPDNRDLLFRIINIYTNNGWYKAVTSLIDDAENMDPKNAGLNYLAGFCYQARGNNTLAEKYYKKAIDLNENNYDANYSLGILSLNLYLKNHKEERLDDAQKYLVKAFEVDSGNKNAINSLTLLSQLTSDTVRIENIKNKLNRN